MPFIDETHVKTCTGIVIWDGITRPEPPKNGETRPSYNIRIAIPNSAPELQELDQLAKKALTESVFKGQLPAGANWPFAPADVEKLGPLVTNHTAFSASTKLGAPPVFDANGQKLEPMQYGAMLYPGAKVQILVSAYAYNNIQKGISFGLSGIGIIDANAPKLDIGPALAEATIAGAFGGTAAPTMPGAPAAAPAAPGAPVAPNPAILDPNSRMTAKATSINMTYEKMIEAGWNDSTLVEHGYMTA